MDNNYKAKEEELDKEDKPTVKKVVKMLKKASKAHADQSKSLEKDLQDDVDETLDKIREANVAKQKSMREILADIWNMNEGKNPFEKTVKESPFDSKRQLKDPRKETMIMMKKGKIIDQGTSKEIISRHGRANLEETFLKIVRSKDEMA